MFFAPWKTINKIIPQLETDKGVSKLFTYPTLAGLLVGGVLGAPIVGALVGLSLPVGLLIHVVKKDG